MNLKNLPFKQSFSSIIKPVVSKEKDELLAIASLNELSHFIPNIDTDQHIDLLPIAFNACVVNRVNKNGDVINTDTALAIYKNFINKKNYPTWQKWIPRVAGGIKRAPGSKKVKN